MTYPYPLEYISRPFHVPEWCLANPENGNPLAFPEKRVDKAEMIGVVCAFDNTPRREYKAANVWNPDEPQATMNRFRKSLFATMYFQMCCAERTLREPPTSQLASATKNNNDNDRFVILNAWNEWAEGMSLEPSDVYGTGFLEIVKEVKDQMSKYGCNYHLHPSLNATTTTS